MEESGRFGPHHALALLRELAAKGVSDGYLRPPPSWLPSKRSRLISYYWVDSWLQDISASLALHRAARTTFSGIVYFAGEAGKVYHKYTWPPYTFSEV